jgi:hypothetical protein
MVEDIWVAVVTWAASTVEAAMVDSMAAASAVMGTSTVEDLAAAMVARGRFSSAVSVRTSTEMSKRPSPPAPPRQPDSMYEYIIAIYQSQLKQESMMTALSDKLDALDATITTLATDNTKALADLTAAINAGNTADVQAALTRLGAINTKLQGIDASDVAADASLTPPAPPATS